MKNKSLWCECKKPKYIGDIYGEITPKGKETNYKVCDKCDKPNRTTKEIIKIK